MRYTLVKLVGERRDTHAMIARIRDGKELWVEITDGEASWGLGLGLNDYRDRRSMARYLQSILDGPPHTASRIEAYRSMLTYLSWPSSHTHDKGGRLGRRPRTRD